MCARPLSVPIQEENQLVDLSVKDENNILHYFACEHSKNFWDSMHNSSQSRRFYLPMNVIEGEFKTCMNNCNIPVGKGQHVWKLIKYFLKDGLVSHQQDSQLVSVRRFIQLTKAFGCMKKVNQSYFFLNQILRLLKNAGAKNGKEYLCWFGGHMTQDDAEQLLQDKEDETFFVRFSETHASNGGFAVAFKAGCDIRHYHIKGAPEQACNGEEYNAGLRLVIEGHVEDNSHDNLVDFVNDRLRTDDVEGFYCSYICPNLPLNATFKGYN
ncbi:uncharacterized protein LOC143445131 [Clavelina lepadiformis]|uniref:uncharacterized protein LOC143445131 n=1 Tax=Clavelina lepadiformis TaxID=159417 RepID=UPI0040430810